MTLTLGKNIEAGQRIRTTLGWRKIKSVSDKGALVKEGLIPFGAKIWGWKSK